MLLSLVLRVLVSSKRGGMIHNLSLDTQLSICCKECIAILVKILGISIDAARMAVVAGLLKIYR